MLDGALEWLDGALELLREWLEGPLELALEVLPMLNRALLPLSRPGVFARTLAALRALLENKGPIGKTLAATMPAFCSRLIYTFSKSRQCDYVG